MSKRVVRILPSFDRIGPMQGTLNTLLKIDRSRVETTVVVLGDASWGKYGYPKYSLESEFHKANIQTINLHLAKPWDLILAIPRLVKLLKKLKPDIVHTQLLRPDIYGRIAARIVHIPVISTIHNEDAWMIGKSIVDRVTRLIEGFTKKFAVHFIAVSQTVKDFVVKNGKLDPDKITVINNGVDLGRFETTRDTHELQKSIGITSGSFVFGTVARVDEQKNPFIVVKTAEKVLATIPESIFLWVGAGPLMEPVKKVVEETGLKDRFLFLGERTDIPDLLKVMDVFFLLSKYEGMPNALLEAMASSLPCVATDVSGNRIALTHDMNGLLVPVGDVTAASSALIRLFRDAPLRHQLGVAAQKTIHDHFSSDHIARQYLAVYETILPPAMP